jgi:hypothetical protein
MKVALSVPCFIDAFFPDVGVATLELLERFGCDVDFPLEQTCCGQPMGNSGCEKDTAATEEMPPPYPIDESLRNICQSRLGITRQVARRRPLP